MLSIRNNFVSLVEYFGKENSDEEDESNDIYTMRDLFKDKIDVFINFHAIFVLIFLKILVLKSKSVIRLRMHLMILIHQNSKLLKSAFPR